MIINREIYKKDSQIFSDSNVVMYFSFQPNIGE